MQFSNFLCCNPSPPVSTFARRCFKPRPCARLPAPRRAEQNKPDAALCCSPEPWQRRFQMAACLPASPSCWVSLPDQLWADSAAPMPASPWGWCCPRGAGCRQGAACFVLCHCWEREREKASVDARVCGGGVAREEEQAEEMHLFGEVRCEVPGSTSGLAERWSGAEDARLAARAVCSRVSARPRFHPRAFPLCNAAGPSPARRLWVSYTGLTARVPLGLEYLLEKEDTSITAPSREILTLSGSGAALIQLFLPYLVCFHSPQ